MPLRRWPKRFTQGYGRMFERLAAEVDVLTGVEIVSITRGEQIHVQYRLLEQQLEQDITVRETATFDYLVLACPQLPEVLEFLDLSDKETKLFEQVDVNPFFVTTYMAPGTERVAAVTFSLPEPALGEPHVVTRQYPESNFISIYSRGDREETIGREKIEANNRRFLGEIAAQDPDAAPLNSDDWAYFPHVPCAAVDAGFYSELEAMQGENRTFYCGGLLAFELVECIAEYSHHLVQTHFAARA